MEFINPIARKRFKNEIKLMNEIKDGIPPPFYATGFPSKIPGEELIWYILIKGNDGSDYEGGEYIGKIMHDKEYPNKPPDYMMLTPNGRYSIDRKICLSNSGYHAGEWRTTWNIVTILIAFNSVWYDDSESGISHIRDSPEKRRKFAKESVDFNKRKYSNIYEQFNRTFLSGSPPKTLKIEEELKVRETEEDKEIKQDNIKESEEKLIKEINEIENNEEVKEKKVKSKKNKIKAESEDNEKVKKKKSSKKSKSKSETENLEGEEDKEDKEEKPKKKKKSKVKTEDIEKGKEDIEQEKEDEKKEDKKEKLKKKSKSKSKIEDESVNDKKSDNNIIDSDEGY